VSAIKNKQKKRETIADLSSCLFEPLVVYEPTTDNQFIIYECVTYMLLFGNTFGSNPTPKMYLGI
jgi:hypothetical protein